MRLLMLFEDVDVEKTAQNLGQKLMSRFLQDHSVNDNTDSSKFIEYVRDEIDPTPNHQYTLWILRTYIKGGIQRYEDLSRVKVALTKFHTNKRQLTIKDIGQIKNLTQLEDLVEPIQDMISGKEQKRQLSQKMKSETIIIYDGAEGTILVPKTEESSCFWGQGTRWCTASTESKNYFNHYNERGPLYIILPKDGSKWQFHLQSAQLMNQKDQSVNFDKFNKTYPWVFQVLKFSEEEQLEAVEKNGYAIQFTRNPSEEVQLAAVEQHGYAIKYISNPSEEIKLAAVRKYGLAIQYISNPSEEIKLAAVKENGKSITYIDDPSERVQLVAVKENGNAIKYIDYPTERVQLAAVGQNGNAIKYIRNPSEEVRLAAVNRTGEAIQYISDPSEMVQLAAVKRNGNAIGYIDNPSERVQLAAVEQNGYAIEYISNPSERVQLAAVEQNGYAIEYISNPSEAVKLAAVNRTGDAIEYIDNPSKKVRRAAYKNGF